MRGKGASPLSALKARPAGRYNAPMPANLTPEYEKAERRYREATSDDEKLAALRQMLSVIPKHKGTDKMQADLKRRISQLRKVAAKKGPVRTVDPFHVRKTGAGQVVVTGPPNTGKSALLATTTNAPVKVADYPYTTALPVPGMCAYEDVQIQLVDTPPMTPEHVPAGLMGTVRGADVIAIVVDAAGDGMEEADAILGILTERGVGLRSVPRGQIDAEGPHRRSAVLIANKSDAARPGNVEALKELYAARLDVLPVSAATGDGIDRLIRRLWQLLDVVRVYTKQPGKPPDSAQPYILRSKATLADLAHEIHRDLPEKMRFARIWGQGRFDGQRAQRGEILRDKDIVEIHE